MGMCDYTTIEKAHPYIAATDNSSKDINALPEEMTERSDLRRLLLKKGSATEVDEILGIGGEAPDPAVKKKLENPTTNTKAENNDVVITADNDGPRQHLCLVLDAPMRGWDYRLMNFNRDMDVSEEERLWKVAGPPPTADIVDIGRTVYEWELNAEALINSGASRDFVNEATQIRKGLKKEKAMHTLEVQVAADGRVLRLRYVAAI
jgi:hypothetical protein